MSKLSNIVGAAFVSFTLQAHAAVPQPPAPQPSAGPSSSQPRTIALALQGGEDVGNLVGNILSVPVRLSGDTDESFEGRLTEQERTNVFVGRALLKAIGSIYPTDADIVQAIKEVKQQSADFGGGLEQRDAFYIALGRQIQAAKFIKATAAVRADSSLDLGGAEKQALDLVDGYMQKIQKDCNRVNKQGTSAKAVDADRLIDVCRPPAP